MECVVATVYIDNKPYELEENQNVLKAATSAGLDIPYFCWHPAMGSVGACRLCAVKQYKDENDTQGKIVMACMTPVKEGARFSIHDPDAVEFRRAIVEFLMVNHPHDCPICDEGGECHLQDMTVMTGHNYREYRFKKRTYQNQNLGPLINHEMNRCIQCYRCERFYADYAGGDDLHHFGAHDHVYFGRYKDGPFESEFSGNLVEVCPTGVFTDKTLKQHYTRKWDLQTAPSICTHCSVGCNTIPGERYGKLRRIRNRYNGQVNNYFLCDRGRYGYGFVNHEKRVHSPLIQPNENDFETSSIDDIKYHLSQLQPNSQAIIGIGSPRASLESNFALRELAGEDNFFAGVNDHEFLINKTIIDILQNVFVKTPTLQEMHKADAVLILGEDITNTAPMMALAVRQAVRQKGFEISREMGIPDWHDAAVRDAVQNQYGPLYISTPAETKLDDIAKATHRAAPGDIARLGYAIAHELDSNAPSVENLSHDEKNLAKQIAEDLHQAKNPLVISGSSLNQAIVFSAANAAWALKQNGINSLLSYTMKECNSFGLAMMTNKCLSEAIQKLDNNSNSTIVVLENDLYRRDAKEIIDSLFSKANYVIAIDHLMNTTTQNAHLVLPAATFAEGDGTIINQEGRAQRFYQVFVPEGNVQESWRWLQEIERITKRFDHCRWKALDDLVNDISNAISEFQPINDMAPPAEFRMAGQKIPRQPHRYSGRTAITAHQNIHEPKPADDPDSPLSFSMEGYEGEPPTALINEFWSPGWNSVQSVNKFQSEIGGPLHGGDPGKRLIEPEQIIHVDYFNTIPSPFSASDDGVLFVPLYHIFGSEELSVLSSGIKELSVKPYISIHPDYAKNRFDEGDLVCIEECNSNIEFPIKFDKSLPYGIAGYPSGLPELKGISFPLFGKMKGRSKNRRAVPAS